jgi:molybdate transport system substrate-binding protein
LILTLFILVAILFISCNSENEDVTQERTPLTISAAISLSDALDEIKEIYEQEHLVDLTFNLGGSGSLAQQIQQGAPVDVFISANQQWMNILEDEDLIQTETRSDIIGNKLVLITGLSSSLAYQSFAEISADDVDRIAIGNPESVPAGKYIEEALISLDKWTELEDKLVLAKDVRQVLTYVETENVDIGFVYESDAVGSDLVKVLATADTHLHEPIIYPGAVIADTKHEKEATDFLIFIGTDNAQEIWSKYGFKK